MTLPPEVRAAVIKIAWNMVKSTESLETTLIKQPTFNEALNEKLQHFKHTYKAIFEIVDKK